MAVAQGAAHGARQDTRQLQHLSLSYVSVVGPLVVAMDELVRAVSALSTRIATWLTPFRHLSSRTVLSRRHPRPRRAFLPRLRPHRPLIELHPDAHSPSKRSTIRLQRLRPVGNAHARTVERAPPPRLLINLARRWGSIQRNTKIRDLQGRPVRPLRRRISRIGRKVTSRSSLLLL